MYVHQHCRRTLYLHIFRGHLKLRYLAILQPACVLYLDRHRLDADFVNEETGIELDLEELKTKQWLESWANGPKPCKTKEWMENWVRDCSQETGENVSL